MHLGITALIMTQQMLDDGNLMKRLLEGKLLIMCEIFEINKLIINMLLTFYGE